MIDLVALLVFGIVTWCVASEGAWGAASLFFIVLFSALLAMNWFEPLAAFLESNVARSTFWRMLWDVVALVGLFSGLVWIFRTTAEQLSPRFIYMHPVVFQFSRWTCGALTGFVTTAFLLTALHTAPLPREFSTFTPEPARRSGPVLQTQIDYQWLGYTQYVSEKIFSKGPRGRIFDGHRQQIGNHPNRIWTSFPIRYATRRESPAQIAAAQSQSGESNAANPQNQQSAPPSNRGTRPRF